MQVVRRDKVAQAVSLWTAIQTQAWRSGDAPAARAGLLVRGDQAPRRRGSREGERGWTEWLRRRDPDVVVYEDFARDPAPTIEILAGVPAPAAPLKRQSGSRGVDRGLERFVAEARS